jgi:MFS transporter, DHA2 family, methylenomycin A resistance protein
MMRSFPLQSQRFPGMSARQSKERTGIGSELPKLLILVAMSLGYGVVQLDVTIVNTALNSIGASLGGGISELQ